MQVNQADFDDSIRNKINTVNNSGYLPQELQVTKQFPNIHDYHFRIQDQHEIIRLEKMQIHSQPFSMQNTFHQSSDQFKGKLEQLISQLDQHSVTFPNHHNPQPHGFYKLADNYEDSAAIQQVLQKANIQEVRKDIQEMQIQEQIKPKFIKKQKPKKSWQNQVEERQIQSEQQVNKLSKKLKKMRITEQDC